VSKTRAVLRAAGGLLGLVLAAEAGAVAIDPSLSNIGFSLRTRWGQVLEGRFPRYEGEIEHLPDGRQQVRLRLSARDVEIVGNRTYTRLTRGDSFFDADRYPTIEFVSAPYRAELLRDGGPMVGALSIRGVRRDETFRIDRATCAQPARDCDVVAQGSVNRDDYGVDRWSFALARHVVFHLRVRTFAEE